MMMQRGKSVEPGELNTTRPNYVSRRQMRARSAGPMSSTNRASRLLQQQHQNQYDPGSDERGSSLPRQNENRALINQHVNPYQEFPSLRRGFTLEGMPIMEKDETEAGDAFAYYFWAIAIFFFTLAVLNFIVLIIIAHVLEISPRGMEAIEFMPAQGSVKFLKHLIAPMITVGSGLISGFAKEPMNVVAENGDLVFQVLQGSLRGGGGAPQLRVSPHEISLTNVENFRIIDPENGQVYFDAFAPEFDISDPVETLAASEVETNRLVSPLKEDLLIKSDSGLELVGAEGIQAEAKSMKFEAGQDMSMTTTTGSITLDGEVNLDPLALPVGGGGYLSEVAQYKLCICGKSGKLFAVPVKSKSKDHKSASGLACLHALEGKKHPCENE